MISLMNISNFISFICLAIVFLMLIELKYSKKVTFISMIIFLAFSFLSYLALVSMDMEEGVASAVSLTIPSLILCFFLSKSRDSRFVFTFCTVDIMGFIVIIMSRAIAILFNDNPIIILMVVIMGFLFLMFITWKYRDEYIKIQTTLNSGWRSLAVVSVLFYFMLYMIVSYPVPMIERREYVPVAILFSITITFVYIVIYQTIMKTIMIYDEHKDKLLLETKIKLQDSQLELKKVYYKMAYTDILTDLKNRTAFEEKKKTLSANIKNKDMLSCLSMDLNNLKKVNDIYGHSKGDELIKAFSNTLKQSFKDMNDIYRIGGDEFIVFFSEMSSEEVNNQINDLKQKIASYNKQNEIKISVAMGLVFMNEDNIKDVNYFVVCADQKMYENKKNMKKNNRV